MTFNEFWESWGIPDGAFLEGKEYAEWLWNEALKNAPKKAEHHTACTKLPSNETLMEFIEDYNVYSDEFDGDDALSMVKDALSEYGNFT